MEGTSSNKILEYAKVLYETGKYRESKDIFVHFIKIAGDNKKNLSKLILCQWNILCVDFLNYDFSEAKKNFIKINCMVEELKSIHEEELKKLSFDSVKIN